VLRNNFSSLLVLGKLQNNDSNHKVEKQAAKDNDHKHPTFKSYKKIYNMYRISSPIVESAASSRARAVGTKALVFHFLKIILARTGVLSHRVQFRDCEGGRKNLSGRITFEKHESRSIHLLRCTIISIVNRHDHTSLSKRNSGGRRDVVSPKSPRTSATKRKIPKEKKKKNIPVKKEKDKKQNIFTFQ
jgi:hypothetical protein